MTVKLHEVASIACANDVLLVIIMIHIKAEDDDDDGKLRQPSDGAGWRCCLIPLTDDSIDFLIVAVAIEINQSKTLASSSQSLFSRTKIRLLDTIAHQSRSSRLRSCLFSQNDEVFVACLHAANISA